MKTFIKDVLDLLALNAKEISYYQKYSIAISSLIIFTIGIAFHLAMPVPANNAMASFSISVLAFITAVILFESLLALLRLDPYYGDRFYKL